MAQQNNSRADLFGTTSSQSYAPHRVWKGSARSEVKFAPLGSNRTEARRAGAKIYHHARRFERQTRTRGRQDGKIGRNGLAILHAMLFDFIDHKSGRLDPAYETIARVANISIRSVARGLKKLQLAGVLNWVRRVYEKQNPPGYAWEMSQDTNAYAIAPATQWKGFHPPADPPAPQPGTWGDHPPLASSLGRAADELRAGAGVDAIARTLDQDNEDPSAAILARMIRNRHGN